MNYDVASKESLMDYKITGLKLALVLLKCICIGYLPNKKCVTNMKRAASRTDMHDVSKLTTN